MTSRVFNPSFGTGTPRLDLKSELLASASLLGCAALFVCVDVLLKKSSDTDNRLYYAGALFISAGANWLYLDAIKNSLSIGFIVITTLMSLGVLGCGVWLFGETMSIPKWIACGLLLVATALLSLPESQTMEVQ
ncbi:MAG: EamA family transporter [Pseudomonadota bacterium]